MLTTRLNPRLLPGAVPAFYRFEMANLAFRNEGNLKFRNVSDEWGFNLRAVSQGMCLADLDNDGDLDVVDRKSVV